MDDARMRYAPPPQPSSTVTTIRALVMLACLVVVPSIALLRGTAVPGAVREYLIQKLGGAVPEPETPLELEQAPPYVAPIAEPGQRGTGSSIATAPPATGLTQQAVGTSAELSSCNGLAAPLDPLQGRGPYEGSIVPQAGYEQAPGYMGHSDAVLANYDTSSTPASNQPLPGPIVYPQVPPGSGPQGNEGPVPLEQSPSVLPLPKVTHPIGGATTIDQFRYIENRLRELGAEYYLLENWGNQGECYRFHCRIAVANSANFTKHFEATDSQPLGAMARVLADVESWRRGGPARDSMVPISPASSGSNGFPEAAPAQPVSPHGPYAR